MLFEDSKFPSLHAMARRDMEAGKFAEAARKLRTATLIASRYGSISRIDYYKATCDLAACYVRMVHTRNRKRMEAKAGEATVLAVKVRAEIAKNDEFLTVALNNGLELLRYGQHAHAEFCFEAALSAAKKLTPPKWLIVSLRARAAQSAIGLNLLLKAQQQVNAGLKVCNEVTVAEMQEDVYLFEAVSALLSTSVELQQLALG